MNPCSLTDLYISFFFRKFVNNPIVAWSHPRVFENFNANRIPNESLLDWRQLLMLLFRFNSTSACACLSVCFPGPDRVPANCCSCSPPNSTTVFSPPFRNALSIKSVPVYSRTAQGVFRTELLTTKDWSVVSFLCLLSVQLLAFRFTFLCVAFSLPSIEVWKHFWDPLLFCCGFV